MSQASELFYEYLIPQVESQGYVFKKSKKCFEKQYEELLYSILFSWDGRGGLTFLNGVNGTVSLPYVHKASKKILAYALDASMGQDKVYCTFDRRIPPMYSKQLLDLANKSDLKGMAQMAFEDKYPIERIEKSASIVLNQILTEIIPFHQTITSETQIYNHYISIAKDRYAKKDFHNLINLIIVIKIMCKKQNIPEPLWIQEILVFSNNTIDDLWNMQFHKFSEMESQFNHLKFS